LSWRTEGTKVTKKMILEEWEAFVSEVHAILEPSG